MTLLIPPFSERQTQSASGFTQQALTPIVTGLVLVDVSVTVQNPAALGVNQHHGSICCVNPGNNGFIRIIVSWELPNI